MAPWGTSEQEWAAKTCPSIPAREQSNQGTGIAPALSREHLPGDGDGQRPGHHRGGFIKRQTGSFADNPHILNFCQTVTHLLPKPSGICPSIITYLHKCCNLSTQQSQPRSCRQGLAPAHPAEHLDSHICHILELLCCSGFP